MLLRIASATFASRPASPHRFASRPTCPASLDLPFLLPPLHPSVMAKKAGFYAVAKGRQSGVYETWDECQQQVSGFSAPVFKKFKTRQEAEAFAGIVPGSADGIRSSSATNIAIQPYSQHETITSVDAFKRKAPDAVASSSQPYKQIVPDQSSVVETIVIGDDDDVAPTPPKAATTSKAISVYCDGAASNNGRAGSAAGYGVWFADEGELSQLNESKRLPGEVQTNNRAELTAAIRAIQLAPRDVPLTIHTDSQYTIETVTNWITNWRRRNWHTASGADVQNRDLIRRLDKEINDRPVKPVLKYVKGHAGNYGNEMADRLAVHGAAMPVVPADQWEDQEPPPSDDDGDGTTRPVKAQKSRKVAPPQTPQEALERAAKAWEDGGFSKEAALRKAQNTLA